MLNSVVKLLMKIHHRDTEIAQRTTERNFPTDSGAGDSKMSPR
jgi:hypothetical protein